MAPPMRSTTKRNTTTPPCIWRRLPARGGGRNARSGGRAARRAVLGAILPAVVQRGADEVAEQRRGALGARLELRVELRGDEERVVVELDHLDESLVGRRAADDQPGRLQAL